MSAGKTITLGNGEVAYVKTTPTKIRAANGIPNLIGALNPLTATTTLGGLGVTSSLAPYNDSVGTLAPGTLAPAGTYLSDATDLRNASNFANSNSVALPGGSSVVISVDAAKNINLTPVSVAP